MSLYIAEANQPAVLKRTGNRDQNASVNNSHNIKEARYDNSGPILASDSKKANFRASKMGSAGVGFFTIWRMK